VEALEQIHIRQFVQQLAAAIDVGNKKPNRVLDIKNTSVEMQNNRLATIDDKGKNRLCWTHEDKEQVNEDPENISKVDHYFSALLAIIKRKWNLTLSIKRERINQVSFEDLIKCYANLKKYPSLKKSDRSIFKMAATRYLEEKNIVMKFHVLKFHSEEFGQFLKKNETNPIFVFFQNNIEASEKKLIGNLRKKCGESQSILVHEEHHLDQPGIHLFTRTTCGHCQKMKNTHNAERKHASTNNLMLHTPRIFEHDEKNVISEMELKSNGFERIMGFPTICFSNGKDKPMEHTGARDLASLTEAFNIFIVQRYAPGELSQEDKEKVRDMEIAAFGDDGINKFGNLENSRFENDQRYSWFVKREENKSEIIGYLLVDMGIDGTGSVYFDDIAVDSKHRGKGIGGALLGRALQDFDAEVKARGARVKVDKNNSGARRWYEQIGFTLSSDVSDGSDIVVYVIPPSYE